MSLLQLALETYNNQQALAGVPVAGQQTLSPISHAFQNAQIEISLSEDGRFVSARALSKDERRTLIPVTERSLNRVGDNIDAHPLSDQLRYISPFGGDKYAAYLHQLTAWAESEDSHPKVRAVLAYIRGGTLLRDLSASGVIELNGDGIPAGGKIEGIEYDRCLVRWRVLVSDGADACWEDLPLFDAFIRFYDQLRRDMPPVRCMVSGEMDVPAIFHPKGVLPKANSAKLISANDSSGFTYRGRFTEPSQAASVGYHATQKAHAALCWLASNHGVDFGGRTFFWWTPRCDALPSLRFLGCGPDSEQRELPNYRRELLQSLSGYKKAIPPQETVAVAALDAATTGRLSVTYYNELRAGDFLERLTHWYDTCVWTRYGQEWSPPLRLIAQCAFGTERGSFLELDGRVLRQQVQRLLPCVVDKAAIPVDVIRGLAVCASQPLAYKQVNRDNILLTACAVIRKYRNERYKEEWTLALDENNTDRSYLYGRLLAIAEQVERITYQSGEQRETNALRLQSVFARQPLYARKVLADQLEPYYIRLMKKNPGQVAYLRNLETSIFDKMSISDRDLKHKLDDIYLLGYYHQRAEFFRKRQRTELDDTENGGTEQ